MKQMRILAAVVGVLAVAVVGLLGWKFLLKGGTGDIVIGNIVPYSGPASAYGTIGRVEAAYFRMVNEQGGIDGRKIKFISVDDGYNPARAVEQARKLVEQEGVLIVFNPLGTPSNSAIQKYLNDRKVPQLFVASGATKWGNYKDFPWTMGWQPSYHVEGRIFGKYVASTVRNPRIAVLYQNDDYGKDYLQGFQEGLGTVASQIVLTRTYEVTDPTVDSQMVALKNSGANVFFNIATPKFAAQAIRKAAEIGWKPLHLLNSVSVSLAGVMIPAGVHNGEGILSAAYLKDPDDPTWNDDVGITAFRAFMAKYYPEGSVHDSSNVYGYTVAQGLIQVLKQCKGDLSRENIMRQAASLTNFTPDLVLPGIAVNTSPTDFYPFDAMQMLRFTGTSNDRRWERFGDVLSER